MTIEKELQAIISKEVEKQLVNRGIASKGWTIGNTTKALRGCSAFTVQETNKLTQRLDSQQKQINKLFADVRALAYQGSKVPDDITTEQALRAWKDVKQTMDKAQNKPKLPRVGQLCYVWDIGGPGRSVKKFKRFANDNKIFVDQMGYGWSHWSFIPTEDIL